MSAELTKQVDRLVRRGLNFWDIKATCGVSKEMLEYVLENRKLRIDNDSLKAEVERLKGITLAQSSEFLQSKIADDRIKPDGHNDTAGRAVEHCLKLQAEVNKLREAGQMVVKENQRLKAAIDDVSELFTIVRMQTHNWNQSKEGKPGI